MATGHEAPHRDLKLRLGCSVFLSHSGADKDFVRFLHERLVQKGYRVFFDEVSLPKAVQLSMTNILAELKDVKLAVLVLSNAFFTRTQHPMRELAIIVAAKIQMLPIFYEFSVPQFKANCRKQTWLKEWMGWVHEDVINRDTIREWEDALEVVSRTNGLEFCKEACNSLEFRDKIVARVCQILKPDLQWSAQGLQGMDRLCQIVSRRFETSAKHDPDSFYLWPLTPFRILGMHGIDGIGKSSLCKALRDFFSQEFESRVCHVELGDDSTTAIRQRLKSAYTWLTGGTAPSKHMSVQQLWNLLREHFGGYGNKPVFLAIDNVQNGASLTEAMAYLSCKFPKGSKIFVTSQSEEVLNMLRGIVHFEVERFPHLRYSEARDIFLYTLFRGEHNTLSQQQEHVVDDCVQMCTLNKLQADYYPLMLVVLASYMVQINRDPLLWRRKLEEMKGGGMFASSDGRLDEIFERSYNSLTKDQRLILIDLALYLPDTLNRYPTTGYAKKLWLEPTYLQDVDQVISKLADLSLLESRDSPVTHSDICFRVHNLVREFVKKEVLKSESCIFMERQSVKPSVIRQLKKRQHIERLGFSNCQFENATLDLSGIENIEVLHLVGNRGLECVRLRGTTWRNLQSLVVQSTTSMKLCVLEANMEPQAFYLQLENCRLIPEEGGPLRFLESSPSSGLQHRGHILFPESNSISSGLTWSNLLYLSLYRVHMSEQLGGGCFGVLPQLCILKLVDLPAMRINLSLDKCPSVREIRLAGVPNLEGVSGLDKSSNLVRLLITKCNTLSSLVVLDRGASYTINECKALERIEVQQSQLEDMHDEVAEGSLSVFGCPLVHISGLSQRQFIGTVSYEVGACKKSLECTPESLEQIFENSGDSIQKQIGTATVMQFVLKHEGLQELKLRDVRDLSSFLAALGRTSGSSLQDLKIICSRHDDCGCHRPAHQPHFDYFGMVLKVLCYSCRRVKDLSSLENCRSMEVLCLYGCVAALKWPDFGKMTSLATLIVESPGSLAYWPSALQSHPSLDDLIVIGSNQIPPEELLACVMSMDPQSPSRRDRLSSFAALEILVDDVYSSRKDKLHIAEALMSSHGKLLCIIEQMLSYTCIVGDDEEIADEEGEGDTVFYQFEARKQLQVTNMRFFHLLSQLLYGLWVEADCSLHECSLTCGTERIAIEMLQDYLQGLLSSKPLISALLLTVPEGFELWVEPHFWPRASMPLGCLPCKRFRSCYAYESLVLISFASIERFQVQVEEELPELMMEIKDVADSFFERWMLNEYGRLPLLLGDEVLDRCNESGDHFFRYIEHQLSAVRVADAVWRLGQLTGMHKVRGSSWRRRKRFESRRRTTQIRSCFEKLEYISCIRRAVDWPNELERRRTAMKDNLGAYVAEMYREYHDMRAIFTEDAQYQDSQSVRKQWHHPVGCFCGLRRRGDYMLEGSGADYIPHDYSVFSDDLVQLRSFTEPENPN